MLKKIILFTLLSISVSFALSAEEASQAVLHSGMFGGTATYYTYNSEQYFLAGATGGYQFRYLNTFGDAITKNTEKRQSALDWRMNANAHFFFGSYTSFGVSTSTSLAWSSIKMKPFDVNSGKINGRGFTLGAHVGYLRDFAHMTNHLLYGPFISFDKYSYSRESSTYDNSSLVILIRPWPPSLNISYAFSFKN